MFPVYWESQSYPAQHPIRRQFYSISSTSFLAVYGKAAICVAITSSQAKRESPRVFSDSTEQSFPTDHFGITRGYSVSRPCQGESREDSGRFHWRTHCKHQGFLFSFLFFNPKPVFSGRFSPLPAIHFPLPPSQSFGTYINITCESLGSGLAIFTSVFLIAPHPLS